MIKRRKTHQIKVGKVAIGGSSPISIQSMVKAETRDVASCVSQIKTLEEAGCEIIRIAIKDLKDAESVKRIKRSINIPLVCDIHFNYRLALAAIKNGADKIRLNPGNIREKNEIRLVAKAARRAGIPIRVGLNSGSTSSDMVRSALDYIKTLEDSGFRDIIISLKASDVISTVNAYRRIAALCDYPLHLGVTASGPYDSGIVKSSIGIGALLLEGIGDTVRVSLTADSVKEVFAAKRILSSLGLRQYGPEIISCPTCGRCQVDLARIVENLNRELLRLPFTVYRLPFRAVHGTRYTVHDRPLRIAVMGCEVNGPGEAKEADIGIAFGKGSGILFQKGKVVKKIKAKDSVREICSRIRELLRSCD